MKNLQKYLILLLLGYIPIISGGWALLTLTACILGILNISKIRLTTKNIIDSRPALIIFSGLIQYAIIGIFFGFYHNHNLSYFEAFIPFVLSPLIFHGFIQAEPDDNTLWLGAAMAAMMGLLIAAYQAYHLDIGRAFGALKNPIIFGDICIVFASLSLIGLLSTQQKPGSELLQLTLILGFISGVLASLLSGSKGGWLSIFTTLVIFIWLWLRNRQTVIKIGVLSAAIIGIGGLFWLAPTELVLARLIEGFHGGVHWFKTGEITEGSVSTRLALWKAGLEMINEHWLVGISRHGIEAALPSHLKVYVQLESDLLMSLVANGFIGFLSKIYLLFSVLFAFSIFKKRNITHNLYIPVAGALLVILYIEFGLSVDTLGRNAFRHLFVLLTLLILTLTMKKYSPNTQNYP